MLVFVEVGADEGVTALDVVTEVGEDALALADEVALELLLGLAFEDFEEEGELGHLDGLAVDIDAVDVIEEDAFALGGGELPLASPGLVDFGAFPAGVAFDAGGVGLAGGGVEGVLVAVPVEQVLVADDEEGAGAAGGIAELEPGGLRDGDGLFALAVVAVEEAAEGVFHDVVDDVGGRVVNAARFADFGLFLDPGLVAAGEADGLAEELLIDLAEDVGGEDGKLVGRVGVVEVLDDVLEHLVVERELGGEAVGGVVTALLLFEMEEVGVVAVVGAAELLVEAGPDVATVKQHIQPPVVFGAAIFADAEEDDAVDGLLHGVVEVAHGEVGVAQGEVAGQQVAPALDLGEKGVVHLGGAALLLGGVGILVEGALEHGLAGEDGSDLVPLLSVFLVAAQEGAGLGGFVALVGADAGIVNRQLLEVGEHGERELGAPGVAAQLVGGPGVGLDGDGGLFGFEEELTGAADAEAVVGGLDVAADFDGILVDDVLVGVGVALLVVDIPAEGLPEGVEVFAAELRLVVAGGLVVLDMGLEIFDDFMNFFWGWHGLLRSCD